MKGSMKGLQSGLLGKRQECFIDIIIEGTLRGRDGLGEHHIPFRLVDIYSEHVCTCIARDYGGYGICICVVAVCCCCMGNGKGGVGLAGWLDGWMALALAWLALFAWLSWLYVDTIHLI